MAPEIPLENQRPAEYVFEKIVREAAAATCTLPARSQRRTRDAPAPDNAGLAAASAAPRV